MSNNFTKEFELFNNYLSRFDKEAALNYAISLLRENKLTVHCLYENILAPSLNNMPALSGDEDEHVWIEHVQTNIVRSVIECAYPFVLEEKKANAKKPSLPKVMILCPKDEFHELGARMGADFFTIAGYETLYIGCNTPLKSFVSAYKQFSPNIIVICISNYFNLVEANKIIESLRRQVSEKTIIAVSGSAISRTNTSAEKIGADLILNSYSEVLALERGVK